MEANRFVHEIQQNISQMFGSKNRFSPPLLTSVTTTDVCWTVVGFITLTTVWSKAV